MLPLRIRLGLVALSLFAVVACTLPNGNRRWDRDSRGTDDTHDPPVVLDEAKNAATAVNAFGADLYAQLRAENGNLVVSPYSVGVALAMTRAGAEGNTASELDAALHLPVGKAAVANPVSFKDMTASVTRAPRGAKHKPELSVANSLWLQKGTPWRKDFLAQARGDFRAGLFETDFADADGSSRRINAWVEKETHNRIKDLVPPRALGSQTRLVLANAIYFKAHWAASFKKEDTKPEDFTLANGQKIRAPLMFQKDEFRLWETDDLQVLKLPYDGRATSMYVLLPRKHDGLPALEQRLDAAKLTEYTTVMNAPGEVRVWLPKFKFTVPTELGGVLQKMGVKDAFGGSANFKGMTDSPGLYISRVIHKAFVETDEVGTEAAAATAVVMHALSAPVAQPAPVPVRDFRADHPFLFVIKHEPTGAILFTGRVVDPTK